ncbi:hypothetical protein JCM10207_007946 [Rhodosporidiobolus poonsookiae]
MAKSSNPVDAHRKAQRKAELKKNKATRSKQREVTTIKKDTRPLEADIRRLTQKGNLSKAEKDELASLRSEVAHIQKTKNEYVEAHPEHRKFVFPDRPGEGDADAGGAGADEPAGLYDRNGRLKHPERSLYYDPVYNPFGVPPPGMPYREKPEFAMQRLGIPTPAQLAAFQPQVASDEEDSDDDDEDEDDDIVMPAGPPPAGKAEDGASSDSDSDSDDDDDIALPPGPPPPKPDSHPPPTSTTSRIAISRPSGRPQAHHFHAPSSSGSYIPQPLPARPNIAPAPPSLPPPPGAPTGPRNPRLPARPPPPPTHMQDPLNEGGPNRAFQQGRVAGPVQPDASTASSSSDATVSAAPSPFMAIPGAAAAAASAGATISAAPQLRDLKKEATAFVPMAMRRKQAQQKAQLAKVGLSAVNAAPAGSAEGGEAGAEPVERGKSLLEAMRERGIGAAGAGVTGQAQQAQASRRAGDEDYARFEQEMKDFL